MKHCGLVQSEMDPCVFYKIMQDNDGLVKDYVIVITWVDEIYFLLSHTSLSHFFLKLV
jgi:hypothetical protein